MRFPALKRGPIRLTMAGLAAVTLAGLPAGASASAAASGMTAGHRHGQSPIIHARPQAAQAIRASGTGRTVATRTFSLHKLATPRTAGRGSTAPALTPQAAQVISPVIKLNSEGLSQAAAAATGDNLSPVGVSAATNGTTTLEIAGNTVTGFDASGNQVCTTIPIQQLLPGQGQAAVEDGQIEYDAANGHFVLMTVVPAGGPEIGTVWVATSDTSDPCGSWFATKLTLSGDSFPAGGTCLEHASLGQNTAGVLIGVSTENEGDCTADPGSDVFALPKNTLYAHSTLSFPVFNVSGTKGVAAMAYPAFSTTAGYFVLAFPGQSNGAGGGYALYRMNGAGGGTPTMTQQASFSAPWILPVSPSGVLDNGLNQGQISSATWDGTRLWFAHTVAQPSGPASVVRYGYIDTTNNTLQLALASHSPTSSEFNPSIGIGAEPGNVETVYLNWATADPSQGLAPSPTVATAFYNGGTLPNLQFADHVLVAGGTPTQTQVVDAWSSVQAGLTCALTVQQYWDAGNSWHTRLATLCAPKVAVPPVAGSSAAAAQSTMQNAFLRGDSQSGTTACSPSQNGQVVSTDPPSGSQVSVGTEVTLNVCNVISTVPNVLGLDDGTARSRIESAGLVVGSVRMVANCTVEAGGVLTQNPGGGVQVARGSSVSLSESTGLKSNGKPCTVN